MSSKLGDFPPHHTWDDDVVVVHCIRRLHQRTDHRTVTLDFESLQISRHGILEQVIRDCECPVQLSIASQFAQAVQAMASNSEARQLLGTPARALNLRDIHRLFWLMENQIQQWGGISPYNRAHKARRMFERCRESLKSGENIARIGFRTRFSRDTSISKTLLSEMYDNAFDELELAAPISAIEFDTLSERNKNALIHLETRLNRVQMACKNTITDFNQLKSKIELIKQNPPPNEIPTRVLNDLRDGRFPSDRNFPKFSEEARLWMVALLVERDSLYKKYISGRIQLHGIACLESLFHKGSCKKTIFTALLSDYYLPRHVVVACLLLIMTATSWNADTVLSISKENAKKNQDGSYTISGLKSKTDQIQENTLLTLEEDEYDDIPVNVDARDIKDSDACNALDLLLWHDAQVTKYAKRTSDSIFVCLSLWRVSLFIFEMPVFSEAVKKFCEHANLPRFCMKANSRH